MIREVEEKYYTNDFVQLTVGTDDCHLIMSADEIILLKIGDKVLIDKYFGNPNGMLFLDTNMQTDSKRYNELFEYNKLYLDFKGSFENFYLHKYYFFSENGKALNLMEELSINKNLNNKQTRLLSRLDLENLFNSDNYDSMYIVRKNGSILFASNKKDGCVINKNIIPSDEEIINIVFNKEKEDIRSQHVFCKVNGLPVSNYEEPNVKMISEIKNLKIYGIGIWPLSEYSDILILSKDGKFEAKWFNLYFIEEDKFKLTTSDICIMEPTIQDVIDYSSKNEIRYIPEPLVFDEEFIVEDEDKIPLDASKKLRKNI